jgi:hypothetical protein
MILFSYLSLTESRSASGEGDATVLQIAQCMSHYERRPQMTCVAEYRRKDAERGAFGGLPGDIRNEGSGSAEPGAHPDDDPAG